MKVTPLPGAPRNTWDGSTVTVGDLLSSVVDVSAAPTRSFLECLSSLATSEQDIKRLQDLADDLGASSE